MTIWVKPMRHNLAVGSLAALSALMIAAMFMVSRLRPLEDGQPAAWYAALLMAPYVVVAVLSLARPNPSAFVFGFARGLAVATRTGTIVAALLATIGLLAVIAMAQSRWILVGVFGGEVALQLGMSGIALLAVLFITQFPLAQAAKQAMLATQGDDDKGGSAFGLATLVLPLVVAISIGNTKHNTELRNIEQAKDREHERDRAEQEVGQKAFERRRVTALQVAGTSLHLCVRSGCVDSLITSIIRDGLAVSYGPGKGGRFLAVVATDSGGKGRYVTDETGILLRWEPDGDAFGAPGWASRLLVVDSGYVELSQIFGCIQNYAFGASDESNYPDHIPSPRGACRLKGDTTVVRLVNHTEYLVAYTAGKANSQKLASKFTLTARPLHYGQPAIRSFLLTQDGTPHVTTADRAPRKSDPVVDPCESKGVCTAYLRD